VRGEERRVSVNQALALLNVPFVSITLIDEGRIAFSRRWQVRDARHSLSGGITLKVRCRDRRHAPLTSSGGTRRPSPCCCASGQRLPYSGGGYENAEALMQDVTELFQKVMQDLVLGPMGMTTAA
jgi:hypothetical protein